MHALPLSLVPGRGPLLHAADRADSATRRRLERAWAAGSLVRLAPAVYCERDDWLGRPAWDRHTLAAAALTLAASTPPVFAGLTAAHLHGLPLAQTPGALTVRAARRGHTGRRATTNSPASARLLTWAREQGRAVPPAPIITPETTTTATDPTRERRSERDAAEVDTRPAVDLPEATETEDPTTTPPTDDEPVGPELPDDDTAEDPPKPGPDENAGENTQAGRLAPPQGQAPAGATTGGTP